MDIRKYREACAESDRQMAMEEDAERWRFLVEHAWSSIEGKHLIAWLHDGVWNRGSLNAAIDHARDVHRAAQETSEGE